MTPLASVFALGRESAYLCGEIVHHTLMLPELGGTLCARLLS
jgi:hypothetical protein